jgi:hypothetical protein
MSEQIRAVYDDELGDKAIAMTIGGKAVEAGREACAEALRRADAAAWMAPASAARRA